MSSYVTKPPRSYDDDWSWAHDTPMRDEITVYETPTCEPTGILDSRGNELWRVRDTVPMGYHPKRTGGE